MTRKAFPLERVLTVFTGYCMRAGVGCAQDVFDHLYPGIMTIGCGAMQPNASAELLRQHPQLGELTPIREGGGTVECERFMVDAGAVFGRFLDVDGPVALKPGEADAAFERFGTRVQR